MDFSLSEEQRDLMELGQNLARRFAPSPHVTWEEAGEFPWEFAAALGNHGLTGINIPAGAGGQGLSLLDAVLVLQSVGQTAPHLADAVQATNFGAIRQIAAFGGPRVLEEVLKPVLEGKALATIAMSEPEAGSAVNELRTRAVRDGNAVRITGSKVFNSNGPHATHYVVWARFGSERESIGAVVVPAGAPGFSRGKIERYLSGEAHCMLHFDDCEAPAEYVLLDHDGVRKMMPIFNLERLGNATRSYAFGELALALAIEHLLTRETGGRKLSEHQGLQWKVADLRMRLDAAKHLLYRAAAELRDGAPDPMFTSIAKCYCNEAGFEAAHQSLQMLGGYGFSTESVLGYLLQRTRGWMLAGGSVEVQRNRIAREALRRFKKE